MSGKSIRDMLRALSPLRAAAARRREFEFVIDMARVEFMAPVAMAMLAAAIRDAGAFGVGGLVRPISRDVDEYLKRLDFYDVCGWQGVEPYRYKRYDSAGRFCELIEVTSETEGQLVADDVARVLAHQMSLSADAKSALFTTLSEITDNVFHHAGTRTHVAGPSAFVCAQTYVAKGRVEFAIVDCGVGIATSLKRNPDLQGRFSDDKGAVLVALQAKVTSNPDRNAGYGLYVAAELARRNQGQLWAASGAGLVGVGRNWTVPHDVATWSGTVITVRYLLKNTLDIDPVWASLGPLEPDDEIEAWIKGS